MMLQNREEDGKSLFFYNWFRTLVTGAILVLAAGVALGQDIKLHTVPPIIIKSVDDAGEPIEIESVRTLQESAAIAGKMDSRRPSKHTYTLPSFGTAKYVEVFWEINDGEWMSKSYSSTAGGFVVK